MSEKSKTLLEKGFADFRVKVIEWSDDGENLKITLRRPGTSPGSPTTVTFVWATEVVINLDFSPYSGLPLVFLSKFESLPENRWSCLFLFDGAPDGEIRCECNEIEISSQNEKGGSFSGSA